MIYFESAASATTTTITIATWNKCNSNAGLIDLCFLNNNDGKNVKEKMYCLKQYAVVLKNFFVLFEKMLELLEGRVCFIAELLSAQT